jgi:hypothetical protein
LTKQVLERLGDLPKLFQRHIPLTRKMLQTLLEGHILCEPIEEDGKPGYRFTATGTFDRLLTGRTLVNHGGGGEALQPSLVSRLASHINFKIEGVALVA